GCCDALFHSVCCVRLLAIRCVVSSFFYCYGAHRYLHSFPTRRSSDLAAQIVNQWIYYGLLVTAIFSMVMLIVRVTRIIRQPRYGDRKSTRLNSSHGSISYAVFCLKKKK